MRQRRREPAHDRRSTATARRRISRSRPRRSGRFSPIPRGSTKWPARRPIRSRIGSTPTAAPVAPRPPRPVRCDCNGTSGSASGRKTAGSPKSANSRTARFGISKCTPNSIPKAPAAGWFSRPKSNAPARWDCWQNFPVKLDREFDKRVAAIEKLAAAAEHAGSDSRRKRARGGDAGGPAPARCVDRRSRARSGEPRACAKTRRVPPASAGRDAARHPAADAGAALARGAHRHCGAVSRRAASRHSGDGLGFAVSALPRRQIAGRALARIAARRPLLVMQYRLPARFYPQRRAHLSSRTVVSSAAGGRAVHARPGLYAARQAPGRGGGSGRTKALR